MSSAVALPARTDPPVVVVGPRPRRYAPLLLWGTVVLGFLGLVGGLVTARAAEDWRTLPVLLALALVAEFLTVSFFESGKQRMSLSFTVAVVMAAVTLAPAWLPWSA